MAKFYHGATLANGTINSDPREITRSPAEKMPRKGGKEGNMGGEAACLPLSRDSYRAESQSSRREIYRGNFNRAAPPAMEGA